jgi:hypothetical protein
MKIILRWTLIYFFIAGIATAAMGFFLIKPPELPYGGIAAFKLAGAGRLFFDALPAVLSAGFVCGAARSFGAVIRSYNTRFSQSIVRDFQETIISALICTTLVFAADEIGTPFLTRIQHDALVRAGHLSEYIASAQRHLETGEYVLASKYLQNALEIDENNAQALELFARAEYGEAEQLAVRHMGIDESRSLQAAPSAFPGEENYTVFDLLKKADEAYAAASWFEAHYYASAALGLTTERDPNYARARRLASEAWNHLANPSEFTDAVSAAFFAKKREGYRALMDMDNLKAYHVFEQLNRQNDKDPDVAHYLAVAAERVRNTYFFLEDVPDISDFSGMTDIYFSIKNPDGNTDIVFIRGASPLEDSGKIVLFLQGFSVISYNADGAFEMSYSVPFAKMFAQPVADFDAATRRMLGVTAQDQSVPCVILEGVDSRTGSVVVKPYFSFADENFPAYELPFVLLAMPYDDLQLLLNIGKNIQSAPLDSLFKFHSKAAFYGFSQEAYLHSLYTRIAAPLVFFLVMILSGIAAWNFRMTSKIYFKLMWIFIPPVISGLSYLLIRALEFFVDTAAYTIISAARGAAPVFIAAGFVFVFAALTVIFVSRRDARTA